MVSKLDAAVVQDQDFKDADIFVFTSKGDGKATRKLRYDGSLIDDSHDELDIEDLHGARDHKRRFMGWSVRGFLRSHRKRLLFTTKVLLFLAYIAYYVYCVCHKFGDEGSFVLTGITTFIFLKVAASFLHKHKASLSSFPIPRIENLERVIWIRKVVRYLLYAVVFLGICIYIGVDVIRYDTSNLQAVSGIVAITVGCFFFSARPYQINWHTVFWGFMMQFLLAIITLRTRPGYLVFKWIGDKVKDFVRLSDRGSDVMMGASFRAPNPGVFFQTAGVMVFINACISLLDYAGVVEFIILKIGGFLAWCLETGPVESIVAGANIFIGFAEAPLLIRPYLSVITKSELHTVMTCGFASITSAFMAMFIAVGAPPTHMLTACLISAPAALAISKLIYPEVQKVDFKNQSNVCMRDASSPKSCLQAIADSSRFSIKLIATSNINMMAFLCILNLVDTVLIWIGERAGKEDFSFNYVSSYLFYPVSWMMGIAAKDCKQASHIMGLKLMATPFVAYKHLGVLIQNRAHMEDYLVKHNGTWYFSGKDIILEATNVTLTDGVLEPRTEAILTYAMCGLSGFPAVGITMGTLVSMSPARKEDVLNLVISALVAGNLASYSTGAVAGVMYSEK